MATPGKPPEDQLAISALDIANRMEVLASEGEWQEIEAMTQHLRDAVHQVPVENRRDVLLALQRSNDLVQSMVKTARRDIKQQLATLKQGKAAAQAYGATNRMSQIG
ncbi:MAG: hypothetical protein AAGA33_02250 [Pseudomonadota bacterium]